MAEGPSIKRLQIDQATSNMVIAAAVALFILMLTLISGHTLLTIFSYQNRLISSDSANKTKLQNDITSSQQLVRSYQQFVNQNPNLLGSPSTGTGQNNGDNAKIILDALPSVYDYPALTTSIQSLLSNQGVTINSIGGTDQQASVSGGTSTSTSASTSTAATQTNIGSAVGMPFTFSIAGSYSNIQNVINTFEKSIRPFQFQTLDLSGNQSNVTLTATAQAFYQPASNFKVTTEVQK